jgi:hypothetical protein
MDEFQIYAGTLVVLDLFRCVICDGDRRYWNGDLLSEEKMVIAYRLGIPQDFLTKIVINHP